MNLLAAYAKSTKMQRRFLDHGDGDRDGDGRAPVWMRESGSRQSQGMGRVRVTERVTTDSPNSTT